MCKVWPCQMLNIKLADLYPLLGMGPVVSLAKITLCHQLIDDGVYFTPENLAMELGAHHVLPQLGLVCYAQYICSQLCFNISVLPPFIVTVDKSL